jgi:hypothetical protein
MKDVTVENIQTGERKTMTPLMAKLLERKYRVVRESTLEKSPNFTPPIELKTELETLRKQYFDKFGTQPHHRLGEAKLKQLIEESK